MVDPQRRQPFARAKDWLQHWLFGTPSRGARAGSAARDAVERLDGRFVWDASSGQWRPRPNPGEDRATKAS